MKKFLSLLTALMLVLSLAACSGTSSQTTQTSQEPAGEEETSSFARKTVSIMTGPEGGFSDEEVELAQRAGLQVCTLGPRILRCETAPLCALSAVLFAAGALD